MPSFLSPSVVNWIELVLWTGVAITACFVYYRAIPDLRRIRIYALLAVGVVLLRIIFAGVKTGLQYYTWLNSDVTKYLLPPYQSIAYLLRYGWTHFMLNAVISVGVALLFFVVLRALHRHNDRYFNSGEIELGCLLALVVGWPGFIVFVIVSFLSVVMISLLRGIVFKQPYTTLGLPFFIGTVVSLCFATPIINAFHLADIFI